MSTNAVPRILAAAISIAASEDGGRLTLDQVARTAGLTKPGLMYHFPTKRALEVGIVRYQVDLWIEQMGQHLSVSAEEATPHQRLSAYIETALSERYVRSDFTIYALAARAQELREIWNTSMDAWIRVPADLPEATRARWIAARLAADGYWANTASQLLAPSPQDRVQVRETILALLGTDSAAES